MADSKKTVPDKRRLTVLVIMILLLLLSFLPYFFYYVPANESRLQEYGFLKLNRARSNIIQKDEDLRNYYGNTAKNGKLYLKTADLLGCYKRDALVGQDTAKPDTSKKVTQHFFAAIPGVWSFLYLQGKIKDAPDSVKADTISATRFIGPCVVAAKELFESFLVIHYCSDSGATIIYQDIQNNIDPSIRIDSLVPKIHGMRAPGIVEMDLQGVGYKIFNCPFQINNHRLLLCGLLKQKEYNAHLRSIPIEAVYPVIIVFVLFLLSLPLLKLFMMNSNEKITARDLVSVGLFVFAGIMLITIIMIQVLLLWGGKGRVQQNLASISRQMSDSLSRELNLANQQLGYFDRFISDSLRTASPALPVRNSDACASFDSIPVHSKLGSTGKPIEPVSLPPLPFNENSVYHNFDRITWIDSEGNQILKAEVADQTNLTKVQDRKYFKMFKYRSRLGTDNDLDSLLMIDPVYSWSNGEFRVLLCRRSHAKNAFLVTMATRLYSALNVLLPSGYGYCLMDADGEVLLHSDTLKNIRENFWDETGHARWIKEAINSRQTGSADEVQFYGKSHILRIEPLHQMPLYLVTFYDINYLIPVYTRILAFSLLSCGFTYLLLFLLLLFFQRPAPKSFLFSSMDYLDWVVPRKKNAAFYCNASTFLGIYTIFFLVFGVFLHVINEYVVLLLTLIMPLNLLCILKLLKISRTPDPAAQGKKTSKTLVAGLILICGLIYWKAGINAGGASWQFVVFESSMIACMLMIIDGRWRKWKIAISWKNMMLRQVARWRDNSKRDWHLAIYGGFVSLVLISFAAIPAAVYTWFAHNHEIIQSVKKEQLNLANGLKKRERSVKVFFQKNHYLPCQYADTVQYHHGIYTIYQDSILCVNNNCKRHEDTISDNRHSDQADIFYLGISNLIGINYSDSLFSPALKDSSDDNLWHWEKDGSGLYFDYARPEWKLPAGDSATVKLQIHSNFPDRYAYLSSPGRLLIMILFIALLLFGLYKLIRTVADHFFLLKFVAIDSIPGHKIGGAVKRNGNFWNKCLETQKDDVLAHHVFLNASSIPSRLSEEYTKTDLMGPLQAIEKMEVAITRKSADLNNLFDCVWKELNEKEKFLLFDLAEDGLMNYKNEIAIFKLFRDRLLVVHDERIMLVSYSFRLYILGKKGTEDERLVMTKTKADAGWGSFRTMLVAMIITVTVFLFLTQQEVSGKITALITALTGLVPLLLRMGLAGRADPEKK